MLCPSCGATNERGAAVCFTCRAVLTALTRGSLLGGRYEIVRLLGRGGMGAVYEARDGMLDETVALKVLRPELAGDEDLVRRFRSEIRLARKVTDAHVARIYEYGEAEGLRWISMELVDGISLKEHVRREGALPAAEALELVAQAARGLEAIHAAGIVHRDLKSANIMLDRQGRIRVMDFGIAKAGEGGTTPGYAVGTPEYMSPEQARGRRVDERSDIYSLAIVAFELFTGDVPYRAENSVSTLLMHIEGEPLQGPAAARLPAAILPVLERALAKEPAQRVATVAEFRREWERARTEAGIDPRIASAARRRRGWPPLVAAATVLAAAVVALVAARERGVSPPPGALVPSSSAPSVPAAAPTVAAPSEAADPIVAERSPRPSPRGITRTSADVPVEVASPSPAAAAPDLPAEPPPPLSMPASAPPSTVAVAPAQGLLFVSASPWAWVAVDGLPVGETPFRPIALPPGPHDVELTYPAYRPFRRRVVIRAGETYTLRHDWATMGVRESR